MMRRSTAMTNFELNNVHLSFAESKHGIKARWLISDSKIAKLVKVAKELDGAHKQIIQEEEFCKLRTPISRAKEAYRQMKISDTVESLNENYKKFNECINEAKNSARTALIGTSMGPEDANATVVSVLWLMDALTESADKSYAMRKSNIERGFTGSAIF